MSASTSRALARFAAQLNLGPAARRQLMAEYGSVESLPEWITEEADETEVAASDVSRDAGHDVMPGHDGQGAP